MPLRDTHLGGRIERSVRPAALRKKPEKKPRPAWYALASGGLSQAELVGADLSWCAIAVALDDPGPVVGVFEGVERLAQVLDGGEAANPESRFSFRSG